MTTSDIKLRIFRQIDSLEKSKLEELYGVVVNFINGQKELTDWDSLTDTQRNGIFEAIEEIETGKEISHQVIMSKYRKKYSRA
jgi:hypothetical protein